MKIKNMAYWKAKNALPGINSESEGNTDLPDGRSGSSPFQKNGKGVEKFFGIDPGDTGEKRKGKGAKEAFGVDLGDTGNKRSKLYDKTRKNYLKPDKIFNQENWDGINPGDTGEKKYKQWKVGHNLPSSWEKGKGGIGLEEEQKARAVPPKFPGKDYNPKYERDKKLFEDYSRKKLLKHKLDQEKHKKHRTTQMDKINKAKKVMTRLIPITGAVDLNLEAVKKGKKAVKGIKDYLKK